MIAICKIVRYIGIIEVRRQYANRHITDSSHVSHTKPLGVNRGGVPIPSAFVCLQTKQSYAAIVHRDCISAIMIYTYLEGSGPMPQRNGSYHIHTFGCQMNARESEVAEGVLQQMGVSKSADDR